MIINIRQYSRKLIPHFLRKDRFLAFVYSIVKPLQTVNDTFNQFKFDIKFKLAFNAQVIYLEQYLNTVYPNPYVYPNNIHIVDSSLIPFVYVWNEIEEQDPIYFYNVVESTVGTYLYNGGELTTGQFDYVIKVPTSVQAGADWNGVAYNELSFKKRVNFYNLAGKSYDVQYF